MRAVHEAVEHLPPELRERYFVRQAETVQVASDLRRDVVFAHHNVLRDAPFTRLDLVSCRNLLIYFQPGPQRKAIALFLYALKVNGVLLLGPSETPGALAEEFTSLDPRWKIFRKPTVRLVAVSGYGRPEDRAASAQAGFDAHLVKPVDTERLFDAVGRLGAGTERRAS